MVGTDANLMGLSKENMKIYRFCKNILLVKFSSTLLSDLVGGYESLGFDGTARGFNRPIYKNYQDF